MESLAALSLACNILQLVELGQKTIEVIKAVYRGRIPDEELQKNLDALSSLTEEVQKDSRRVKNKYGEILLQSAARCYTAANDLQEELRFIYRNAKRGDVFSALKVTTTVGWRKNHLERHKQNLDKEEKRMQTSLLASIWSSSNTAQIDLHGVRRELRFFIEQYRRGHRETTELVYSEGVRTREHVSHEAERINKEVKQVDQKIGRLVALKEAEVDVQIRERFLQSLNLGSLNRRTYIKDAHSDSLKWVFVGDNDDDYDEDHDAESTSNTGSGSASESARKTGSDAQKYAGGEWHDDQKTCFQIKWDSFSNWLRSTDAIYWISGKPGSGKTTLVKYILDDERTKECLNIWSPGCEIASHYFWRPGIAIQKNLDGLFCSLLYQLLEKNTAALEEVMLSFPGTKDSYTDWSSTELRVALLKTLDVYTDGVCLFLDGLDEIDPEDGTKDGIPELLDLVSELSQRGNIKLCLASRPDPRILEMHLSMYPRLRLQDLNYRDLMAYAKEKVKFPKAKTSTEYGSLIISLVDRAEGVFLWLILATNSINEGLTYDDGPEILKERIDRLPSTLNSLYQDMWARAGKDNPLQYRQTAALYFKILLGNWDPSLVDWARNTFNLMLATTPIADGILNGLEDASKLVCPNTMLQEYQRTESRLKIYCVGLVDIGPNIQNQYGKKEAANCSWYGHMYDNVFTAASSSVCQFIHRTASDFLRDTEAGSEILSFDKSSDYSIHYRTTKAWLARQALFIHSDTCQLEAWADRLREFREAWEGTNEWVPKDWKRLCLISEKLANSGRLLEGNRSSATPIVGIDFLRAWTKYNVDDELVISRLKNGDLSQEEKSAILMSLSDSRSIPSTPGVKASSSLRTFRELFCAGADPNWQAWERVDDLSTATFITPWQLFLLRLSQCLCPLHASDWDPVELGPSLFKMADVALSFISGGAKLNSMVDMVMTRRLWRDGWHPCAYSDFSHYGPDDEVLHTSIPAHTIVKVLTDILRHSSSRSDGGVFPESCVRLERACADQSIGKTCRVFWKIERLTSLVLSEATDEMQMQFGSRLLEAIKRQLWRAILAAEGERASREITSDEMELFESLIDDESWVEKCDGIGFVEEWYDQLESIRSVDTHSVEEWVTEHRHKFQQSRI